MKYVKVCPRCSGRLRVHYKSVLSKIGWFPTEYVCEKCGYKGKYFVEVLESELGRHRELLKKKAVRKAKKKR
jgi:C4-type Zn-finger protein